MAKSDIQKDSTQVRKIKKVVFPVGGLGTRFLPATKSLPKEMLPVVNKPIIQYAFEEARNAGIEQFIFVTGRNKSAINNHFDHAYELESKLDEKQKAAELETIKGWLPDAGKIAFVRQQKPLGLGHSVWCARNFIADDEPFVVMLADEMVLDNGGFLKSMIDSYNQKEENSSMVAVATVADDQVDKYGIVATKQDKIIDMIEKPKIGSAPSNLAISGRYILQPEIFKYLENCAAGSGGEIQLTDAMKEMSKDFPFYYKEYKGQRFDCGSVRGYLEANIAFALQDERIKPDILKILKKYIKNNE